RVLGRGRQRPRLGAGDVVTGAEQVPVIPAQRTTKPVLLLTCMRCERVRQHPPEEPLRAECPDPNCRGWLLTAALGEPGGTS
ncbi:MAG: hypothetical protein LC708_03880, partial [Actinobacteria bacterium]|nr:hypothetical protein [Actinomycetota bacterium]